MFPLFWIMELISNSSLMFITKPEYQYDWSLTILFLHTTVAILKHFFLLEPRDR